MKNVLYFQATDTTRDRKEIAGLCGHSSANALGNFIRNFHASAPSPTCSTHNSSVFSQQS